MEQDPLKLMVEIRDLEQTLAKKRAAVAEIVKSRLKLVSREEVDRLVQAFFGELPTKGAVARAGKPVPSTKKPNLKCPKCDRKFGHALPLARHLSATHRLAIKGGKLTLKLR